MRSTRSLACLLAFIATPASASIARGLSVEEMAQQADAVVMGRVTSQAPHWSRSHRQIFTWVEVRVEASWVGRLGVADSLTVLRPGGELDGIGQTVLGEPTFAVGEQVVLFLQRRNHIYRVLGMSQGLFRVNGSAAVQELGNLALARPGPTGDLSIGKHGEGAEPPQSLAALERRVRAAAGVGARTVP